MTAKTGLKTGLKTGFGMVLLAAAFTMTAAGEVCKTQSQMQAPDRDKLAQVVMDFAKRVQSDDSAGIQAQTIAEYQQNFGGIGSAIGSTSPKIKTSPLQVDSLYILDASDLKQMSGTGGTAQFFCSLNKSTMETDFEIPGLPPGIYSFAIVKAGGAGPWQLSFLLRQEQGAWKLAGFYPRAATAAGHDGLWYWTTARQMAKEKQAWNAFVYYQEAALLLRPVGFVSSTHLEKLQNEQADSLPPAIAGGIGIDSPLVVKGKDGMEYRFTGLTPDDSTGKEKIELVAHLKVETNGDGTADRKRNIDAMSALLAAYPELRQSFHGVWIFAEVPGQTISVSTEMSMTDIPS